MWQTRVKLILDCLELEHLHRAYTLNFQRSLTTLMLVDPTNRQSLAEYVHKLQDEAVHCLCPWLEGSTEARVKTIQRLRQKYVEVYGDPEDPEAQARLDLLLDRWEREAKRARQGRTL